MYTILINTASYLNEIQIFDRNKNIISEISQHAQFNEYEILITWLRNQDKTLLNNISKIICVVGPGSFTGVRVGVTIANTIAFIKKIPIYSLDAFMYFKKIQTDSILPVFIDAGKYELYAYVNDHIDILHIDNVILKYKKQSIILFAKEHIKKILSKDIHIVDYFQIRKQIPDISDVKAVNTAIPLYIRPASITI